MCRSSPASVPGLDRRQFLRSASALIALPALEALGGTQALASEAVNGSATAATTSALVNGPKNFVAIGSYLAWHQPAFSQRTQDEITQCPRR